MERYNKERFNIMEKIIVYSTQVCPYCIMLKNFLKQNNISFEEVDLTENKKLKEEIFEKTGQMVVPITKIGEEYIIGYNLKKIKEILKL